MDPAVPTPPVLKRLVPLCLPPGGLPDPVPAMLLLFSVATGSREFPLGQFPTSLGGSHFLCATADSNHMWLSLMCHHSTEHVFVAQKNTCPCHTREQVPATAPVHLSRIPQLHPCFGCHLPFSLLIPL